MDVVGVAGSTAAVAAGVAGAAYLVRGGWRATRRVHRLADGLLGDPEEGRPGVVVRLDGIDRRLDGIDGRLDRLDPPAAAGAALAELEGCLDRVDRAVTRP